MLKKTILSIICAGIILLVPYSAIAGNTDDPFEDPDGPTKGGLDDFVDYVHLANGIGIITMLGFGIDEERILLIDGVLDLFYFLCSLGFFSINVIFEFLEAFDIMELQRDGL